MNIELEPHPIHKNIFVSPTGEVFKRLEVSNSSGGYHTVHVTTNKTVRRHTLILETYKGLSFGRVARHLDGNPANDSVENLEWGTQKENLADAILHGNTTRGEKNKHAKLTANQVLEIRRRLSEGESSICLVSEYRVSLGCICDISHRRTWSWL